MSLLPRIFPRALLLAILFASSAWPQASTATVSGTVRDQSGAVIPSATVALANTATNVVSNTKTNDAGVYAFPGIIPGQYRLTVEVSGMQKYEATLTVQVQQSAVVDPVLTVGQTVTQVEVRDVTPILTVDSPTLGHTLERSRIEQLPINGRALSSLLSTVPGMEGTRAFGLRGGSQEFVLDGAAQTDKLWGGTMNRQPGLDTIQEFKVEVNNSSAKFTVPTTIIMSTKSGSNQLHGAAFETNRNNAYGKARSRIDPGTKPPFLNRNEFGASAGGPVYLPKLYNGKDRTFWFFAYEAYRNINPQTAGTNVFTQAMRNGDFSGLVDSQGRQTKLYNPWTTDPVTWARQQFNYNGQSNRIDPALLSPLAKQLYSVTPLPTLPDVNPLLENNWYGPLDSEGRNWTLSTRIDHRFSDKDAFYGRISYARYLTNSAFQAPPTLDKVANYSRTDAPNKGIALSWVRSFSPTFFNEVLISDQYQMARDATGQANGYYADKLGLPNPFNSDGFPGIYYTGLTGGCCYYESMNTRQSRFNYLIIDDNATKISGRHELMFGVHHRRDQLTILPDQQNKAGNNNFSTNATSLYDTTTPRGYPQPAPFTGSNIGNMYIGVMNYQNKFSRGDFYMRGREYALYFQDNFKVTPRLTLNLGLRYEYRPAYSEKNNILVSFDPANHAVVLSTSLDRMYALGATVPSLVQGLQAIDVKFETYKEAGFSKSMWTTPKTDFGPRLGFAYRFGDGLKSFILRGGYRMSYFPIPLRSFTASMGLSPPFTAWYSNDRATGSRLAPDGIQNWAMRSIPDVIAGVNSRDQITTDRAANLGRGWAVQPFYFAQNQADPRVQDWNLTVEKEIMPSTVARVAYVGNHGGALEQYYSYNQEVPTYIWYVTTGLQTPSGAYSGVLRRPFDKVVYGDILEYRGAGWSNYGGAQFELERRYSKGYAYQLFYVVGNDYAAGGQNWSLPIPSYTSFMPGAVPADVNERNRFINYQRDTGIPKHRVRWNWIVDLPFGKGKRIGGAANGVLDKVIGGWQIAGMGYLRSTYFSLPTGIYPNGNQIETYGYKYPIQDCTSGKCYPGYLWTNGGYIPANKINSTDPVTGKPNGIMGVPANYKPAGQPIWPWPANPSKSDPMYNFYGSNTVWVPLKDGTVVRTTYNDNLHPWRQQYLPSVRQWNLDSSLFKTIPVNERIFVRFNADFFNVFNHPGNPSGVSSTGVLSTRNSGSSAREIQLTLRLTW